MIALEGGASPPAVGRVGAADCPESFAPGERVSVRFTGMSYPPRLAARWGLAGASILLGVIWASWHLPLFYVPGTDTYGQSFPMYLLQVTALSVAIAWLYWRTQGSLLLTMLMHAAINNTNLVPAGAKVPGNPLGMSHSLAAWLTLALLWIPAAYFLVRMRGSTGR